MTLNWKKKPNSCLVTKITKGQCTIIFAKIIYEGFQCVGLVIINKKLFPGVPDFSIRLRLYHWIKLFVFLTISPVSHLEISEKHTWPLVRLDRKQVKIQQRLLCHEVSNSGYFEFLNACCDNPSVFAISSFSTYISYM